MNLAAIADVPFDDEDAFADFQFCLATAMQKITQVMYANSNFFQTYPLADNPKEDRNWLLNLQSELNSMFLLNNLTGLPDFASTNLDDEDEFYDFMLLIRQTVTKLNLQLAITT